MLIRLLLIAILALTQNGCDEGGYPYDSLTISPEAREKLERDKREFVKIEDLKVGDGPLAAWGRRIKADLDVRYTDGTTVYQGSILDYVGFLGSVSIHNREQEYRVSS